MAKQGSRGSITQQKKRYNDDFYLNFDAPTLNKGIVMQNDFKDIIRKDSDFSISFSIVLTNTNGSYVLMNNTTGSSSLADGFLILLTKSTNTLNITFTSFVNNVQENSIYVSNNFTNTNNNLIHYVINYNTSSNTFNILENGIEHDMVGTITSDWTRTVDGRLVIGNNSSLLSTPYLGGIKSISLCNRVITQQEANYIYQTGVTPKSLHQNVFFEQHYNQIPTENQDIKYKKVVREDLGWNGGAKFSAVFTSNGYIETTVKDNTAVFMLGLAQGVTDANVGSFATSKYNLYCSALNNTYKVYENGIDVFTLAQAPQIGDVLKVERISGTVTYSVNNVVFYTSLLIDTTDFNPLLVVYRNGLNSGNYTIEEVSLNGTVIRDLDINNLSTPFEVKDVVSNYDYAKLTLVTPHHGNVIGFTNDELGLNVGTSTFLAYSDFYTKVAGGVNWSGGGDSIIYKGQELRKFGLSFNGSNQYLRVPNFEPTSEKGYTILMMYKTVNGGYLMHKDLTGGKEFRQEARSAANLHLSYSPITSGVDFVSYDYLNSSNFQQLNFITAKHGSSILTAYNSDAKGVVSLNGSDEVLESGLDGLDGGFNDSANDLYICAKSDATNAFDGVLCYFAIAKGELDNEEVKRTFNNGLLSNASDISRNTQSEFILIVDLNNPFDDAGTLKFPNLGTGTYDIIADGWLDLFNLEASKVEINSLR